MTHGWTTGPVYYAALAMAETFGSSNASQVVDLNLPSPYRPGYAIYENGVPTRLGLINYVSDDTGASDYEAVITFSNMTVPDQVYVRYLTAPSVTEKWNITWCGCALLLAAQLRVQLTLELSFPDRAGQTMGGEFQSDGRLQGTQQTQTIACDQANNECTIPVRAPSYALVFLTDDALSMSSAPSGSSTLTFATTVTTGKGRPGINPSVLATMNGHGGPGSRYVGSTGTGVLNISGIGLKAATPGLGLLLAATIGWLLVMHS